MFQTAKNMERSGASYAFGNSKKGELSMTHAIVISRDN